MADSSKEKSAPPTSSENVTAYEKPAISWEEKYEPVGFGLSCAQQEGNPGCMPGPILS